MFEVYLFSFCCFPRRKGAIHWLECLLLLIICQLIWRLSDRIGKYQILFQKVEEQELVCLNHSISTSLITPYSIAIGIYTVERTQAPDLLYPDVVSILDSLFVNQPYLNIDKVHVFDGSIGGNGSQVKYFKYTKHIEVHPLVSDLQLKMKSQKSNARKLSFNYLLTLQFLYHQYQHQVDAYLTLEDDLIFDPNAAFIIWEILNEIQSHPLYLVDGYVKGKKHTIAQEAMMSSPVSRFRGLRKCCSQSYLLSPKAVEMAIPMIEQSLNGSAFYLPLDLYLTSHFLNLVPGFRFFFPRVCWVQHIGYPYLGLGRFHRGCSRMTFEMTAEQLEQLKILYK